MLVPYKRRQEHGVEPMARKWELVGVADIIP